MASVIDPANDIARFHEPANFGKCTSLFRTDLCEADNAPEGERLIDKYTKQFGNQNTIAHARAAANLKIQRCGGGTPQQNQTCVIRADPDMLSNYWVGKTEKQLQQARRESVLYKWWFWPLIIAGLVVLALLIWAAVMASQFFSKNHVVVEYR